MKKIYILLASMFVMFCYAQGASISWKKRLDTPVILNNDTIKVKDQIKVLIGSNIDGSFKFVQFINGMNEPIRSADSRASMKKQEIKFFKSADDVYYAFTKYFCINLEAAILSKEIELIK
ncbi:hypothetical protein [Elizabethkingia anophelis]|uniref:hypothetical protein n=1 Tax=Elizabethkingia anophelis TaxID=1117645 RepID=UPI002227673F|nr:hypothetical protein [Elizabethkingia anophelis]MCW2463345.1 hypothetical protein [Elizabethkingia anophelis]MCW2467030.1 hypothetical protein [Elizabethkingia anophelis]MCW2470822.1 hypothetical protein [Elizabethkingia anophelis]HBI9690694.1 hypothetical protein [Elizabethkingia anophelis]HBI9694713.1 hypothetical protein [Elizabethkingia anophelis]